MDMETRILGIREAVLSELARRMVTGERPELLLTQMLALNLRSATSWSTFVTTGRTCNLLKQPQFSLLACATHLKAELLYKKGAGDKRTG